MLIREERCLEDRLIAVHGSIKQHLQQSMSDNQEYCSTHNQIGHGKQQAKSTNLVQSCTQRNRSPLAMIEVQESAKLLYTQYHEMKACGLLRIVGNHGEKVDRKNKFGKQYHNRNVAISFGITLRKLDKYLYK